MTLGEKIKAARKSRKMTQKRLAGSKITRNMLSRIENGTANPSLETIRYLASELKLPVEYFLSENDNLLFYEKNERIAEVYRAYEAKDYIYCINKISAMSGLDNELAYLLASSAFNQGKTSIKLGALKSAHKYLALAREAASKTVLDTSLIEALIPMYEAISSNVQSPLLEFDPSLCKLALESTVDLEFYNYLTQDYSYAYSDPCIRGHVNGKLLIKARQYHEAIKELVEASEAARHGTYNAYVMFGIYTDLEYCYKQLYDFENAYRYSSKRMSMLEGFKS